MTKANDHTWNISRHMVQGRETYGWAVLERAGKTIASGQELSRSAALLAAMKAIHQLENPKKPKYE